MIKFSLIHHTWQAHERRIASFFIYEDDFLLLHRMKEEQFSEIENFPRLFFIRGNFLTLCSSNFRSDARKSEENFGEEAFVNNIKVCLEDICSGT